MYFDINKYIVNMVPELKRTKDTNQYKLLSGLMKGYEEIKGTQNQMENMELGIYPFIEPDFYYTVSSSQGQTQITENIEEHLNQNLFFPTEIVQSENITFVKSVQIPQFIQTNMYLKFRKQYIDKNYKISKNNILNINNGEVFNFTQNGDIIDYNRIGNIIYCLEQDRLEQFDQLNGDIIFSQNHSIQNIKSFQLIPNGLIIKHNDESFKNYNFIFNYDFEYEGVYYSLNQINQNITQKTQLYTFQDHLQGHIPFSRTNQTIQQKLIQNIVYSNIMQQDQSSPLLEDVNIQTLFDQYTDIGYKEKIKIISTILQNTTAY